jgi:A/G-specific adenine glycosylase
LPWRRDRTPYSVWLAEVMLQQTQAAAAAPYYERFLARFPTVAALAAAREEEVLAAWQGLGYYARARKLKAAAAIIVAQHGGRFPDDEATARALPGVGPYTAGAVLSIAYDRPAAAVDANVARVLVRLLGEERPLATAAVKARLWQVAAALVPRRAPGAWTQTLIEFGALVCLPRSPDCPSCPVASLCAARAAGRAAQIPAPRRKKPPPVVEVAVAWAADRAGRLACVKRADRGVLAGFYELPAVDVPAGADPRALLGQALRALGARRVTVGEALARVEHGMFHRTARLTVYRVRAAWDGASGVTAIAPEEDAAARPLTTASRKLIRAITNGGRQ